MMGKMGIGLAALLGKELLGRGAAGGALGALGSLGKRMVGSGGRGGASQRGGQGRGQGRGQAGGRNRQADPLEDALRRLLDGGRAAAPDAARNGQESGSVVGEAIPDARALPLDTTAADASPDRRRAAAMEALLAHVASFIDGRVRVRHPVLREAAVHAPLREALERAGCFTGLTFNAKTGSLLLEYDPRLHSRADFLEAAVPVGLLLARCA